MVDGPWREWRERVVVVVKKRLAWSCLQSLDAKFRDQFNPRLYWAMHRRDITLQKLLRGSRLRIILIIPMRIGDNTSRFR